MEQPTIEASLEGLELDALCGSVRAADDQSTAYFGHFCTLLHLEYLTEMMSWKRRISKRDAQSLQKFGWAAEGMPLCLKYCRFGRRVEIKP